ncbi:MAG: hypothetical protein JXA77_18540 [Bacteroidales bacterium]|nr:hypothetical protein [Bacteroidales bacterium]MBN2818185.1 hypothetical protein [Bacteroidales bacterium]
MGIQNKLFVFFWIFDFVAIAFLIAIWIKNKKKRKVEPLIKFANENNSEISDYDTWDKTLIGIDNNETNSLFFIRKLPEKEIREVINLSEISGCRISKTERKVKYEGESVNVTDRIELFFSFYNRKPELSLEFYNSEYDQFTLSGELQLAQKWLDILNTRISANLELTANKKSQTLAEKALKKESIIANERKEKSPGKKEYTF